ncbi:HAD-IA family hydrolase [Alkalilimnicola sp. S0819]|nr:HAD-IA family hydrolase [Alkalilimnicola sp. S0819]MPQ16797.1 HAD-IA family hydrolase [Alkalilimnicola sp. S0819]
MQSRAVLLDLDGTLLDTAPDLIGTLNDLRAEEGLEPLTDGMVFPAVSHGSGPLISRGFDLEPGQARFQPLRQRFLDRYQERVSLTTRAFDGMDELLHALDALGVPWGVVTNKPGGLTEPLLKDLGYYHRAACVVSGDTLPWRKPHPAPVLLACEQLGMAPADCILVGDAARDVEAGHRAGVMTLVALFGYLAAEDRFTHWGADGVIRHPLEVLQWLAGDVRATSPLPRASCYA